MSFDLFRGLVRSDTSIALRGVRDGGFIIKSHHDGEVFYRLNGNKAIHEESIRTLIEFGFIVGEASLIDDNPQRFTSSDDFDYGFVIARKCFGEYIATRTNSADAKHARKCGMSVIKPSQEKQLKDLLSKFSVPWTISSQVAA